MAEGVVSATGTLSGSPSNVLGPQTFDFWQGAIVGDRIQSLSTLNTVCDCFCIDAHNIGSVGATIAVLYRLAGVWTVLGSITPTNDDPIMVLIPPKNSLGYGIQVTAAPTEMPKIGIIYAGPRLVFPTPISAPFTPFNYAQKVEFTAPKSMGGQLLGGTVARKGKANSVPFTPIDATWAAANLPAFRAVYDVGTPFFFATCPLMFPDDLAYCWRAENAAELRPTFSEGALWVNLKLEVEAYGA
jgi:hypothetical protein